MISMVKMLLKGEVGGHALIVIEITLLIMENHGKIMDLLLFFISEASVAYEAIKLILSLFDLDLCLQGPIYEQKPML